MVQFPHSITYIPRVKYGSCYYVEGPRPRRRVITTQDPATQRSHYALTIALCCWHYFVKTATVLW